MAKRLKPVLITAGGTGGHVYPGLAVARALMAQRIPVIWMGTRNGLEARVIPEAGIDIAWLSVNGLRGKGAKALLFAPFKLVQALFQSVHIMIKYKPSAILGMGGFVAGPGGLVGALMGKPLIIHEQNAIAGLTNKILKIFSRRILEGFPGTFSSTRKVLATGNPVREDIAAIPDPEIRLEGRTGAFRLLVVGGSLGAQKLNEVVPHAISKLPSHIPVEVVHQAGEKTLDLAKEKYEEYGISAHIVSFIEDMAGAYEWADLIVCRSGALTVAEVSAAGLASVLVPFPHAVDDHQSANGRYLAENGAAIMTQQSMFNGIALAEVINVLATNREKLLVMSCRARSLALEQATEDVAAIVAEYAGYAYTKKSREKITEQYDNNYGDATI